MAGSLLLGLLAIIIGYVIYPFILSESSFQVSNLDKSIAVLPFTNMSNDPEQEYFSDGISEEILNSLTQMEGLKVAGRTSSFSFKGKDDDLRTIGEKLNVSMVLEGSVRKASNRVRITAQLINVEDGYHIWSEQYDKELEDIFSIQEEIAGNIVDMLKLTVLEIPEQPLPTENVEAWDLYLKARYFLSQDADGVEKAMEYFQKAIDLDPDFALAYAGKAHTFQNYGSYGILPSGEAFAKSRIPALKSISLDERKHYGHIIMAYVYLFHDWDWKAAKSEYDQAIELGLRHPDHFITWYDSFLYQDYEKAISNAKIILEWDPLSIEAHWHLGACYLLGSQFENAVKLFNSSLELNPNYSEGHRWLGLTYAYMGRFEEAIIPFRKALELTQGKGPANSELICVLVIAGKQDESARLLKELHTVDSIYHIDPLAFVGIYAQLGDLDEAFRWLEGGFRERSMGMTYLKIAPFIAPLRSDPRYEDMVRRMNFPE